jgi:ferredoxin/flavodoxin
MDKIKKVSLYYFSGTGNTLLVCKKFKEELEKDGVKVRLYAMEKESPANMDLSSTIGLAFPVAVFTTYPLVMDFIKKMPSSEGTKVFMIDSMGAFSCGIRSVVKKILIKKGYEPLAAMQVVMPDNFYYTPEKAKANPEILTKGLQRTSSLAERFLKGELSWKGFVLLPELFYHLSQFLFNMPSFRKAVKLSKEKCTKCGLCVKLCPVDNIIIHEYPVFSSRCQMCMRCLSFCPTGAIYRKKPAKDFYKAVKVEELI